MKNGKVISKLNNEQHPGSAITSRGAINLSTPSVKQPTRPRSRLKFCSFFHC